MGNVLSFPPSFQKAYDVSFSSVGDAVFGPLFK